MTADERRLVTLWQDVVTLLSRQGARRQPAATVVWRVKWRHYQVRGRDMALVLTNAEKVQLSIQPVDKYGNPARVDGVPVWGQSDATIGSLEADADGMSAEFVSAGPLGVTQINVTCDADLGEGVRPVVGTLDIQVEASEAVSVNIVAATPEPQ